MIGLLGRSCIITLCFTSFNCFAKDITTSLDLIKGVVPKSQQLIKANKDDVIQIKVTSDEPGEFHLHAYQLDLKLSPKESQTLKFKAYATGRFQFEWHPAANATPAPAHRHEPLAKLEVFP
jgi:hypothetical protein